jgi:hypothetical protein
MSDLDIIQALQVIESRLDSRFDRIDDRFNRIDSKIDAVEQRLGTQAGILVGQNADLVHHIKRSDLLEQALASTDNRIGPIEKEAFVTKWAIRAIIISGVALAGGLKGLEYLKVIMALVGL